MKLIRREVYINNGKMAAGSFHDVLMVLGINMNRYMTNLIPQ